MPDTLVWAPRGREIGFVSERDGNVEVYVINANGSGQRNLTRNEAREQSPPSWSPNGRKIAFVSDREGDDEVYVMNANGTGQLRLTRKPGNEILPVWSPRRKTRPQREG